MTPWLYVASPGLITLLRNVKSHKNSYWKEKVHIPAQIENNFSFRNKINRTIPVHPLSLTSNHRSVSCFCLGAVPLQFLGEGRRGLAQMNRCPFLNAFLPLFQLASRSSAVALPPWKTGWGMCLPGKPPCGLRVEPHHSAARCSSLGRWDLGGDQNSLSHHPEQLGRSPGHEAAWVCGTPPQPVKSPNR